MTNPDLRAREQHVMPTYGRYPLALVRGKGVTVWDEDGNPYLDFAAGIATVPLGHSHPVWRESVHAQVDALTMVSNLYFTQPQAQLADRLAAVMDLGADAQIFFANSGAEANEASLKLARKWGLQRGRRKIIALEGSFHGRTASTLAATGQPSKRKDFEPLVDWFDFVAPGDIEALTAMLDAGDVAGVLLEPVLGEGGVRPLEDAYLQRVRELTLEHDVLLIADEVQTGVGRCGAWRASSLADIRPDVVSLAKGLGGGLPIGASIARAELAFGAGDHASTFGGGPVVCAASLAVLQVIEDDGLLENATKQGERIQAGIAQQLEGDARLADIRGRGLLIGIELAAAAAKDVVLRLIDDGMLATEASPNVVRLSPPLIITDEDADTAVSKLVAAIRSLPGPAPAEKPGARP